MTAERDSLPGKPLSIWLDTTPSTQYPSLQPGLHVDVAIAGGGLAGITTALLLQESGRSVALIEGRRIAEGVTGNTTAKLTSQHGLIYDHLIRHAGEEKAALYARANQAAIEFVADQIGARGIDADFSRVDAFICAQHPPDAPAIEAEVEAARRLGLPASFETDLPLPLPAPAAIRFSNQARYHPRKYLLALAAGLVKAGGHIFEQTRVLDLEEGEPCTITTDMGDITAGAVVIATHAPAIDKALYFARLSSYRSYVLALELDGPPPAGMYLCENPFWSLRSHPVPGGELLFVGGEKHKTGEGGDTEERYRRLEQWARAHFSVRAVRNRWSTQDNWTPDRVPYIGKAAPGSKHLYVATGFGGWGMTGGAVAGMLLSDLILGRENDWARLYDPNRFNLESVGPVVREGIAVARHFVGDRLAHPELPKPGPGEGAIVDTGKGKIALYQDEDGTLHRLSPACTHMGCLLNWNPAERTWDCPCHGSRYAANGAVIQAPAVTDMEKL